MKAFFCENTQGVKYADLIVMGLKRAETRNKHTLRQLIGERVAVVRTRKGKKPEVIGYITISDAFWCKKEDFGSYQNWHLVPPGSKYDATDSGKWLYVLENPETCMPYELPSNAVRHGYSWCEF